MSARSARRIAKNARPQVSKTEREIARLDRVLAVGAQAAGPHADQQKRHVGKGGKGGRAQVERRAVRRELIDAR